MNLQHLLEQYISFQRSLGSSFVSDAAVLRAFGRSLGSRASVAGVQVRHVNAFLGKARPVTRTWFTKLNCLRCFFRHALSRGYITKMPLPLVMPKRPPVFAPYIYTNEEIGRLLQVIDVHPRSTYLGPRTIRTMFLLIYGAALRLREATNLTRADVDLHGSVLTIRNTKFGKTRLVPVGPQLKEVLAQYEHWLPKGQPGYTPFFVTTAGEPVKPNTLEYTFRILCDHAGIGRTDTREQPRIHDLRHTAAVHRLTFWYQRGADVQRLLHHLSIYLGHVHLRHTQVYLSMTPELLHEASKRFDHYARKERGHA